MMLENNHQLRFLLLQVIDTHYHRDDALENMSELEMLVETFGGQVISKMTQHRVHPHPATYIGPGKVAQLVDEVKANKIDVVVVNGIAKSSQLFRLEKEIWQVNHRILVWDRVGLILSIFEKHASTKEAKLQIELARIKHEGPRIYGLGLTALSRQGGGIGTRGAGETNIEQERRVIKQRIQQLEKQLKQLAKQKRQRVQFRNDQGIGPVALVGYTSAGKTTLFNTLTGKSKVSDASLFTTLDTVVGKMKTTDHRLPILISDTIGFIENLPPILIDAFESTLIESLEAKLLLHVIDSSDPQLDTKIKEVEQILNELEVDQPLYFVFNKIDLLTDSQLELLKNKFRTNSSFFISAQDQTGIDQLKMAIVKQLIKSD